MSSLVKTLEQLPSHPLPNELWEMLNEAARAEKQGKKVEHDAVTLETSKWINSFLAQQMGNNSSSEAAYSPKTLDLYDAFVWGFNSPFLWRIGEEECQQLYQETVGSVHCEVAVGTGLFLKNLTGTERPKELTLVDLNEHCLSACAERVINESRRDIPQDPSHHEDPCLQVEKLVADITDPESIPTSMRGKFDTVGANFLLHCLHGDSLMDKKGAIQACASLLSPQPEACFFGSTILGEALLRDGEKAGAAALYTLEAYNKFGIFGNRGDGLEDLEKVLREVFQVVEVRQSGYCGVWKAWERR